MGNCNHCYFWNIKLHSFLNLVIGLKIALPILCVFLIGSILLQSGKGSGLAAIGGLGDQSAFGTRSSTFLSKVTYLIGAASIVATIFLFKLSIPTRSLETMVMQGIPDAQHTHEHNGQECEHEHEHEQWECSSCRRVFQKMPLRWVCRKSLKKDQARQGLEGSYHNAATKEGDIGKPVGGYESC